VLDPHSFTRGALSGFASTSYSEAVSTLLVSFKEKNQVALASVIANYMKPLMSLIPSGEFEILLIPAPSRPANFAKRGFQPTLEIARSLAKVHPRIRVQNVLVFNRQVFDQVGLTSIARAGNLAGSMRVNQNISGKICFILDDVTTTGATALEAFRALELAGARVLGLLVFSES
jgi:predicted amidophosphoribosyltransferase